MSDNLPPKSPLVTVLKPGIHATAPGPPCLSVEERPDMVQLQLIARKGETAQVAGSISEFLDTRNVLAPLEGVQRNGLFICATGPREYWVFAEGGSASGAIRDLNDILSERVSVFDQSAGRCVLRLAGERAIDVLAKGTPLDLQGRSVPVQGASHTVIDHIPALVAWRANPDCHDISVPRSYAGSLLTWLREAALEYGRFGEDPGD